jgi:leukotriene-A4 hydrolase
MQDSPAIKVTYEAEVKVESQFVVKMSANETMAPTNTTEGGVSYSTYHYYNQIKMPSYLIAIAVGDLEQRSLGNRVSVITEPSNMDFVANELESL